MSDADDIADPAVIDCPACEGTGQKVRPCSCRLHGDQVVIGADDPIGFGEPFRDCTKCDGTGTTVNDCGDCDAVGRARAQMVMTVVNVDAGRIASATIIPGAIEPVPTLVGGRVCGRYELPVKPVVDDLIRQVGGTLSYGEGAGVSVHDRLRPVALYGRWRPDMSPEQARHVVARQLVGQRFRRHSFFFTRSTDRPEAGPDEALARLCRLAEALCVDLRLFYCPVLDKTGRPRQWQVDFALPGAPNPTRRPTSTGRHPSLAAAVHDAASNLQRLIRHLQVTPQHQVVAPAHQIRAQDTDCGHAVGGVDDVAAQVQTAAGQGGLAIWRDGRWHYSPLTAATANRRFVETGNGQVHELVDHVWRIEALPPAPAYWGQPIPARACPECESGTVWTPCRCIDTVDGQAFAGCEACGGTGWNVSDHCTMCGNIGQIRYGVTVTLTDLEAFTTHVGYTFDADATRLPQRGLNIWEDSRQQLPEPDRLTSALFEFGIDLADVTDFTGQAPPVDLLDGAAMVRGDGPADALAYNFTANASRGRPGARIFLQVTPRPTVSLERLVQIAHGLDYIVAVAVEHRHHEATAGTALGGSRWGVALLEPNQPLDRGTVLLNRRYLDAAVAACVDSLPHVLNVARRPGPTEALPAPQQPDPPRVDTSGLESALSNLAARFGGVPASTITARIGPERCTVVRHMPPPEARYMPPMVLAEASTIRAAVDALTT